MVERLFSQIKIAKTKKRSLLSNEALDDLLTINSAQVPLKEFSSDEAVDLWWSDKGRRPNQKPRKPYSTRGEFKMPVPQHQLQITFRLSSDSEVEEVQSESGSDSDKSLNLLDEWDDWMESSEIDD